GSPQARHDRHDQDRLRRASGRGPCDSAPFAHLPRGVLVLVVNGNSQDGGRDMASIPEAEKMERTSSNGAKPAAEVGEYLYLIGRPKLKQYLRFMRDSAVDPPDEATLVGEWQAARGRIQELEVREAGAADHPEISKIAADSKYRPLLVEFLKDPLIRNGFNSVPTEVAFVELDRMVVYQKHIDLAFVRGLQERLGPAPSDEKIFTTCLPFDHPQAPGAWSRLDDH